MYKLDESQNTLIFNVAGTVIEGTMRAEDLIPTFISTIRTIDPEMENPLRLALIDLENNMLEMGEEYFRDEISTFDLDYLFDMLNQYAPDGYYFGAHPGDGSDYGFWECEEF